MQTLFIFLIFLGPLVFFHELGHFFFARLFGVKVEVFSIGFGPKIFKKKMGETEYAASVIPLGGYVKMFGDNPLESDKLSDEERKVSFTHKSKFAKFWIVFGGPLANFILAFVIYFFLIAGGEKVPQARLGKISPDSNYYSLGLRTGDVIAKINKTEILGFDDLNMIDSTVNSISVTRDEELKTFKIKEESSQDFLTNLSKVITGLRASVFTDSSGGKFYVTDSLNATGLKSLEQVVEAVNGDVYVYKILDYSDISNLNVDKVIKYKIQNVSKANIFTRLSEKGLYPSELAINNVSISSPSAEAGLQKNDIIVEVSSEKVQSFEDVQRLTQAAKSKTSISYKVLRQNEVKEFFITPEIKNDVALIGVQSAMIPFSTGLVITKSKSVLESISKAIVRTKDGIVTTFMGFKKLIFGEVSIKNIGGPFAIANVAADSFNISLSMFFRLMALISINLGLINLFPIPVLDGGHIVMLGLETIYGGPLPKNILMRMQQVGVSLLFLLMFVAIFNDISRFF